MGQVAITVNGRSYRFDCGDGEEPRLTELADYVKSRMEALSREHGNVGEERLLLMAALTIADELWDATGRRRIAGDALTTAPKPNAAPKSAVTGRGMSAEERWKIHQRSLYIGLAAGCVRSTYVPRGL